MGAELLEIAARAWNVEKLKARRNALTRRIRREGEELAALAALWARDGGQTQKARRGKSAGGSRAGSATRRTLRQPTRGRKGEV